MMFYWDAYDFICIWNNLRIRGNSIYGACEVSGIPVSEFRWCRKAAAEPKPRHGFLTEPRGMQIINI